MTRQRVRLTPTLPHSDGAVSSGLQRARERARIGKLLFDATPTAKAISVQ